MKLFSLYPNKCYFLLLVIFSCSASCSKKDLDVEAPSISFEINEETLQSEKIYFRQTDSFKLEYTIEDQSLKRFSFKLQINEEEEMTYILKEEDNLRTMKAGSVREYTLDQLWIYPQMPTAHPTQSGDTFKFILEGEDQQGNLTNAHFLIQIE